MLTARLMMMMMPTNCYGYGTYDDYDGDDDDASKPHASGTSDDDGDDDDGDDDDASKLHASGTSDDDGDDDDDDAKKPPCLRHV